MTAGPPTDDGLFEEALDIVIRLQNAPANPVTLDLIRQWRTRSPDHEAAWREAAELHGMAGQVLGEYKALSSPQGGLSRRTIIGGLAGLAGAAGAGLYGPAAWLRLTADRVTATGEVARFELAGGTTVTLAPASAIRHAPDGGRIDLLEGAACFDVADAAGRPFEAAVDGLVVQTDGGAFSLSRESAILSVGVDRGRVAVTARPDSAGQERLQDGDWYRIDGASARVERGRLLPGQFAAWRDGQLLADDETVAAVVSQIGRWHSGRIVMVGSSLGARRISGVFDLRSPRLALEAVVHPFQARVRHLSPWLTVISTL